jgi:hypothetical protein
MWHGRETVPQRGLSGGRLHAFHGFGAKLFHPRVIGEDADRPPPVFDVPTAPPRLPFRKRLFQDGYA